MALKEEIVLRLSSLTQGWLNARRPPRRGRKFDQNLVVKQATADAAILAGDAGQIVLQPFDYGIFRVYLRSIYEQEAWLEQNSWAVDFSRQNREHWNFNRQNALINFSCPLTSGKEAYIILNETAGTISVRFGSELVIAELLPPQATGQWLLLKQHLPLPGEVRVFGLGENTPPMNKAGQKVVMWNTDNSKYQMGDTPLYKSLPVVIFHYVNGPVLGLVYDNPSYAVFSLATDGKSMDYAVQSTELSYFILLGPTLPEVMRQLTVLTGRPVPLPKWALGYQQSRWGYASSARIREIAAGFRNRDIPCDVLHLDIDYMDGYKCFTWGDAFHDYQDLIREMHDHGFKIVTIIDPGLKIEPGYHAYDSGSRRGMFISDQNGRHTAKRVWPGPCHFPDFVNAPTREWWAELVQEFAQSGVDGIWCDMNEPSTFDCRRTLPPKVIHKLTATRTVPHGRVHNVYGLLMSRATHEGLRRNTRLPYVITRSTYLGGQKFAVTWTGDNHSNWEHFRASIPMILNLGLSGQPVTGPDIGGFRGSPTPELYARWILQGALYPFSRTHTLRGTGDQEPWSFGPQVEAVARHALKLRYRLLPYLYSLLFEAVQSGHPMMRPLFYHAPTATALRPEYYETEFLLGPHLLAAPLMDPVKTRTVYLPPGKWYSWWCRKEHEGGQTHETTVAEDTELPMFVRENAVIPLYPDPPAFIPDHSLPNLEIMLVVKDQAEGLVAEYFDDEALLVYAVRAVKMKGHIDLEITLKEEGLVPAGYQPPETLHLLLNHEIRQVALTTAHKDYALAPDPVAASWTRLTVTNPAFPLKSRLIL